MNQIQGKRLARLLLLGTFLVGPFIVKAQEPQRFVGKKRVGNFVGEADYTYRIVDNDTLLDGPFLMKKSDLEALLEKEDASFLFKGAFRDGYANGPWRFQFGTFESDSKTEVVDYQYRVLVSGVQEEASGRLLAGKPDGEWKFEVNRIEDSDVRTEMFKSTISFANGLPQRSFRIENDKSTLVGRFLRDGLAHDEWSLYTDGMGASETWYFEDGVLRRIVIVIGNNTVELPILTEALSSSKIINLNARYLKALQLQRPLTDTLNLQEAEVPALLSENAEHYQKIDAILSELGKSSFLPQFKVKVPFYPLDSLERLQADSIGKLFPKSKTIADSLLNSSQLNILKRSDKEVAFLYAVVEGIDDAYLRPIKKIFDYGKENILEFAPRKQLMANTWPEGRPSKTIQVDEKTENPASGGSFELFNSGDYNFSGDDLRAAHQIAEYAFRSLDSIQSVLDKKMTSDQRRQELEGYEKKLIAQSQALDQLVDSVKNDLPKSHSKVLLRLQKRTEKQLADYADEKAARKKLGRARELVECFEVTNGLAQNIAALPKQWSEIQELYQDAIWNPFMVNVMSEEVKKRITTAYSKVLVPYFLESAEDNNDCGELSELVAQMDLVYDRMLELRELETRKLERKLRREDDPQTVMRLMNQPIQKSEE